MRSQNTRFMRLMWAVALPVVIMTFSAMVTAAPQAAEQPASAAPKPDDAAASPQAAEQPASKLFGGPLQRDPKAASPQAAEQPASVAPNAPDPAANEAQALAHNGRGMELYRQGAYSAALAEFLEAKKLFPELGNVPVIALCLRKLGRYDEALDAFEGLLRDHGETLKRDAKEVAQRNVIELRGRVGTIEITGGERGAVISVDGQVRGEYPLIGPLRVASGSHLVRLYKEGFEPREVRADVAGARTSQVTMRLVRLVQAGKLRVDEASGGKLDVVVDGMVVGQTPWEGPIAAGDHSVMLRGPNELGTLPKPITVQVNKQQALSLTAERLDASLHVAPSPVDASVAIDGIFVGRGVWDGRLRPGSHTIKVIADGYFPAQRSVTVNRGAGESIAVALQRDPSSLHWRTPGRFGIELVGSVPLSPSFGGDVSGCDLCSPGIGIGGHVVVNGSFETWKGFSFGASGGYLSVQQKVTERQTTLNVVGFVDRPDQGVVDDTLVMRAFRAGAWAAYRMGSERLPIRPRLGAGLLLGSVSDRRTGTFRYGSATGACPPKDPGCFSVGPVMEAPLATWVYLAPEVRAAYRIGNHIELSVGVEALILIGLKQPEWNSDLPGTEKEHPINASTDGYGWFDSETLAGQVSTAIMPSAGVRYEF